MIARAFLAIAATRALAKIREPGLAGRACAPSFKHAAFFPVISAQASTTPENPVPIFRKYGDECYLWKVFDTGNDLGVQVVTSEDEKAFSKGKTSEEKRVGGRH